MVDMAALVNKKHCSAENCTQRIWSKGVCKFHTPNRSINKVSIKQTVKLLEKKAMSNTQMQLFNAHWALKYHMCEVCNAFLGSENKSIFHDHLLEKAKFPKLRFVIENLLLVCFECHQCKTNGFPKEKHQSFINKAYILFNINK